MNEQKTGADIKAQQDQTALYIHALAERMQLKKWAVEQAIKCVPTDDIQKLVKFFYDFVSKGEKDV